MYVYVCLYLCKEREMSERKPTINLVVTFLGGKILVNFPFIIIYFSIMFKLVTLGRCFIIRKDNKVISTCVRNSPSPSFTLHSQLLSLKNVICKKEQLSYISHQ